MICKNCGSEIDDNAWECPYCVIDITQEQRDAAKAEKARASQQASEEAVQMAYQQAPPPPVQQAAVQQPYPQPAQQAYQQPQQQAYRQPTLHQPVYQQTDYQHPIYQQQAQPVYQQPYQQAYQQPQDKIEAGLIVLTVLIPLVGFILGLVNLGKGQKRSGLAYLLTSLGVSLLSALVFIVPILLAAMMGDLG